MVSGRAPRFGKHYNKAEIALIYLVDRSPKAKDLLATILGRTPHAIDYVWRWVDGAGFPPQADNRIKRQIEWAEQRLGPENRARIRVE